MRGKKNNAHVFRYDASISSGSQLMYLFIHPVPSYQNSIYHLCKLKFRMSDEVFHHRIEKKMHFVIIFLNALSCITFLALDVFNSAVTGTVCYVAAVPTGCRNSNIFGDCEEPLAQQVMIIIILNSFVCPSTCLLGCICCMSSKYECAP